MLHEDNRETHDIKRGDIIWIPAGAIVYAINKARNEKLRVAILLRPISTPGHVEVCDAALLRVVIAVCRPHLVMVFWTQEFYGAAGRNPETFFASFSDEVLEAAFDVSSDLIPVPFPNRFLFPLEDFELIGRQRFVLSVDSEREIREHI